jgi:hypothetical protein
MNGRAYISYFEVEAYNPINILYDHKLPVLQPGGKGEFDEHGQMPTFFLNDKLYYIGWSMKELPYRNSIGIASVATGYFAKYPNNPILGIGGGDTFTGTICVEKIVTGYIGYYLSCIGWENADPLYDIKIAVSFDGINWDKTGEVAIPLRKGEGGICSATVSGRTMLYCYRANKDFRGGAGSYKIGMAKRNEDGKWERQDELIQLERNTWDSEMQCYPYIFKNYLFYNGNNFGQTGIGFAEIL